MPDPRPDRHKDRRIPVGLGADRERAEKAAARYGMTLTAYIVAAVRRDLDREEALASMGRNEQ